MVFQKRAVVVYVKSSVTPVFDTKQTENAKTEVTKEDMAKIRIDKLPEQVKSSASSLEIKNDVNSNDETVAVAEVESESWSAFGVSIIIVAVLISVGVLVVDYL